MIFWYALKSVSAKKTFFNLSTLFSILSLGLGVATLVTAMSLINGYEMALKNSVFDVFGHLIVTKSPLPIYDVETEIKTIQENSHLPVGTRYSPFIHKEVLAVNKGHLVGALIEGLDINTFKHVSRIDKRILSGQLDLQKAQDEGGAYIGKGLAEILNLKINDSLSVVLPLSDAEGNMQRKVKRFVVLGLLDLGKYEFNNRYILTDIKSARELVGFSEIASTGIRFKFINPDQAEVVQNQLMTGDYPYLSQTWKATNSSLFEAISFEKMVLFLILSIMTVVAAFNLTTGLYLNVYKKILEVSVLKTLGMRTKQIYSIFVVQGLLIGVCGYVLGVILGLLLIALLNAILASGLFLPPEVYKLNALVITPSLSDLILIFASSMMICFIATLSPAKKSIQLKPAEGLRYD